MMKCTKYRELDATHIFVPIAIETAGTWDKQATELIEEIGRRCTLAEDPKETIYLYQRIAMAIQRGYALSFTQMFNNVANETRNSAADTWSSLSSSASPEPCFQRIQKA